jgi:thiol-disulfide isomerase/thioredoxin
VTSLMFAALLRASLMLTAADATAGETYADARRATLETGKPLVVMVSTDWCAPCQQMKKSVIPQVRKRGLLKKVSFAMVNPDFDSELAEQLTGGGPIPQLVMYRQTPAGWKWKKLIGGQSVETVEEFINDGLVMSEKDGKAKAAEKSNGDLPEPPADVEESDEVAAKLKVKPVSTILPRR